MISSDRFHDNGDGTAWLVFHDNDNNDAAFQWDMLDRPCGACGETGWRADHSSRCPGGCSIQPCNCIDGRHTFTIEVRADGPEICERHDQCDCGRYRDVYGGRPHCKIGCGFDDPSSWPVRELRVSVVPGMVLPIEPSTECEEGPTHLIGYFPSNPTWALCPEGRSGITLPPDARPGMWAVLLKLEQTPGSK